MVDSIVIYIFLGFSLCVVAIAGFVIWMWRRKSAEDRKAFSNVLNDNSVTTYKTPQEYAEAARMRDPK